MRTIVITGATSGVGRALVDYFAKQGERVIAIGRNEARLKRLVEALDKTHKGHHTETITADFASLNAIAKAIKTLETIAPDGIDAFVHNAAIVPRAKKRTEDGFELQYQVNHLAVVLLTLKLRPLIEKRKGTVIITGSEAHQRARFDEKDLQALKKYHPFRSYCRTKLYNLMFTHFARRRLSNDSIRYVCVHPGRVKTEIGTKDTSKFHAILWKFFTRKGAMPEATIPTYDMLLNAKTIDKPYVYLGKPIEGKAVALDANKQAKLFQVALKELKPYL